MKSGVFFSLLLLPVSLLAAEPREGSLSGLYVQLQQLRQEVQSLHGQLEEQQHLIQRMQKQQRELYLDLDQRLGSAGSVAAAGTQTQPPLSAPQAAASAAQVNPPPAPQATAPEPRPQDSAAVTQAYNIAFNSLQAGRYDTAIKQFDQFLESAPKSQHVPDALYWRSEAWYVKRNFLQALPGFQLLVYRYPDHVKAADALLKSGLIYYQQEKWPQAREAFEKLQKDYADTTAATLAARRLQRMTANGH
ncbi:MAG: tol-pal system protein YbgF [gamma proteobacterium symbiont of Bathyaustriella thionipta]|nr:tol-pal system protein YbgF [gamma proteobacterium symbiont of Bathyaustriella thionipta]